MLIELNDIQRHLRVDLTSQDDEIEALYNAAVDYVSQYLGRDIPWSTDDDSQVFPDAVRFAVLLLIGDMYENREAGNTVKYEQNPTFTRLLELYRSGMGV